MATATSKKAHKEWECPRSKDHPDFKNPLPVLSAQCLWCIRYGNKEVHMVPKGAR